MGDLFRGQRHDDAGLPLQPRTTEQLVDNLIGPSLDPRVALQHRFGLDAQQLGRAIQRDDNVLADLPRTATKTIMLDPLRMPHTEDRTAKPADAQIEKLIACRLRVVHGRRFSSEAARSHENALGSRFSKSRPRWSVAPGDADRSRAQARLQYRGSTTPTGSGAVESDGVATVALPPADDRRRVGLRTRTSRRLLRPSASVLWPGNTARATMAMWSPWLTGYGNKLVSYPKAERPKASQAPWHRSLSILIFHQ